MTPIAPRIARWIYVTAGLTGLAGLMIVSLPSLAAQGNLLVLDVSADPAMLDLVPSPTFAGQGPFYIPGDISDPRTGRLVGRFHCWGFFIQGGAATVVSQEFELFGRGKIQVQGVEDFGPRAVTGGTGDFANVRGEITGADLSRFPDFTVTFRLIGAGNR